MTHLLVRGNRVTEVIVLLLRVRILAIRYIYKERLPLWSNCFYNSVPNDDYLDMDCRLMVIDKGLQCL